MRDQATRDEKTLQISSALFVFALIALAGVGVVAWVASALDLAGGASASFAFLVLGVAVVVAGRGLVGRRRGR